MPISQREILIRRRNIGQNLKALRIIKGLSKQELVNRTGLKFDTIRAIEDGKNGYKIDSYIIYLNEIS